MKRFRCRSCGQTIGKARHEPKYPNRKGPAQPGAKLTDAKVRRARELYAGIRTGGNEWTQKQLALAYGVSLSTMSAALTGRSWKHLPPAVKK